ncbi:MAG TPA: mechanosensitive ion channel family protein [Opitutaceae bacterium]|jgi:MscS family membrane protein|nr:mechanosensitive ion channel family protein [Opitutaceae bacterium]
MKRWILLLLFALSAAWPVARAADNAAPAPAASPPASTAPATEPPSTTAPPEKSHATPDDELKRQAAAATVLAREQEKPAVVAATGLIERIVDSVLGFFNVDENANALTHYGVAAFFLLMTLLFRRVIPALIIKRLHKTGGGSRTGLRLRLFPVLENPAGVFVGLLGIFCALNALKLSELTRYYVDLAATVSFSLVIFWGVLRAANALLDHLHQVAIDRRLDIAPFMPWIKKALITAGIIFGALLIAQSLGADVKAFLAGLGIGGLAFALAAQDTIANFFGSVVVALDQPFKIGETVTIGTTTGTVEDIGLRSTKIRTVDKSLVVVPNKTVATEMINNLSRFTQRRVEQVINLTYDATPEKMTAVVDDLRQIILREEDVEPGSVMVYFRDYNAAALGIWVVYMTKGPDFQKHMALRERINLAIMRAVAGRGLAFVPTSQTIVFDGPLAKQMAEKKG